MLIEIEEGLLNIAPYLFRPGEDDAIDVEIQEEYGLQRPFECAAVNAAGVPALTPEFGSPHFIEEDYLDAAVTGIHDVMRALDMLPGGPEPNPAALDMPVDYPSNELTAPSRRSQGSLGIGWMVNDVVRPGCPIADITTPHGERKTTVKADQEGYILGRRHGVATYENDILVSMAARDGGELIEERT